MTTTNEPSTGDGVTINISDPTNPTVIVHGEKVHG